MKKYLLTIIVLLGMVTNEISAQCMVNTFDDVKPSRRSISADDFRKQEGQEFPIDTLQYAGPDAINFVLLGEGYTAIEQNKFMEQATNLYDGLFNKIPFNQYKNWFNLFTIKVISNESGISHPGVLQNGEYVCPEGYTMPIKNVDTYFGIHFDSYNIHRLPTTDDRSKIYNLLEAIMPDFELVGILCNSSEYGGAGGDYLTCTAHQKALEIITHEFGHTFAGLADEYYAGDIYLHEYSNLTTDNNPETITWKHWWGIDNVGAYPLGGSEMGNKYYKPVNGTCEMEHLFQEFCPVCREVIIEEMHERVKVISKYEPEDLDVTMDDEKIKFDINKYYKGDGCQMYFQWSIDDKVLEEEDKDSLVLKYDDLEAGRDHIVKVKANEINPYVKDPEFADYYASIVTWRIRLGDNFVGVESFKYDDFSVESVKGGLMLKSEKPHALTIYNLNGHRVAHANVCGEKMINLPAGIYIVDGKKIMIE